MRASYHPRTGTTRRRHLERVTLGAVYLTVALSLIGFATFGLHPELVARVPGAARSYGLIFSHVGQVQVWVLFAALATLLLKHTGWRWLPALAAVYGVTFLAEFVGTGYGIPFGGYAYSGLLGPKWFDQVPVVIPLSWFCMAVPSFAFARAARSPVARVALAAGFLVAWDLALDPAMSFLTPYWVWAESGPYYGMPWINVAGWFLTAVAVFTAMSLLRAERWISALDGRWLAAFYAANLLMPLGMLAAAGMWLGVLVTVAAVALLVAVVRTRPAAGFMSFPTPADARS